MSAPALPRVAALDGLRGLAVAAVLLFHGGYLDGGFLGVDAFFTLSGYLITALLLTEAATTGRVSLRRFWARRARRLLPALLVVLAVVAVVVALTAGPDLTHVVRDQGLATLGYVANWQAVLAGHGYWDAFTPPSPLEHTWSLAVEEQFYLLWPLLVLVALRVGRGRRGAVAVVAALGLAASLAASMGLGLAGVSPDRRYLGTDTRMASILVGALLAVALIDRHHRPRPEPRPSTEALAGAALAVLAVAWLTAPSPRWSPLLWGGFAIHAVLVGAVVVAALDGGPTARLLSWRPLVALGLVSYGLYLWHWPVYVLLTPAHTGWDGPGLLAARVGVSLVLAVASYVLVERPVRRGAAAARPLVVATPGVALVVTAGLVLVTLPTTRAHPPSALLAALAGPDEPVDRGAPVVVVRTVPGTVASVEARPDPHPPATATTTPAVATTAAPWIHQTVGRPASLRLRPATADDPLRVLLVGDSVMLDAEPGIEAALEASGAAVVEPAAAAGFSLGLLTARARWPHLLATVRPDLVVTMFGFWDQLLIDRLGLEAYTVELDRALDELTADGASVLLLGPPAAVRSVTDPRPAPRDAVLAFADAADRRAGQVAYVATDPVLAPGGTSQQTVTVHGVEVRVRKRDGTHLCPDGAALLGTLVLDQVAQAAGLVVADPSWIGGPWRGDARYDQPAGACG